MSVFVLHDRLRLVNIDAVVAAWQARMQPNPRNKQHISVAVHIIINRQIWVKS